MSKVKEETVYDKNILHDTVIFKWNNSQTLLIFAVNFNMTQQTVKLVFIASS
jgi:hypothetical protein